jgi:hypothetical protein
MNHFTTYWLRGEILIKLSNSNWDTTFCEKQIKALS